ncbi:MAG TPA: TetR family transcriptional regulator [Polyangiaceae bacterium]|nr:TetR family transcriptional regulator [Polyangiaceae bacterium]
MRRYARPTIKPRKVPVQARSTQLVADIVRAAVRVLEREGPHKFTTVRVAETAGVSVGSLYQYFPNKQSILYRLQADEWSRTSEAIDSILQDEGKPPAARLRAMVRFFFHSECDEAPFRLALDAAAPEYHSAPESRAHRVRGQRIWRRFMESAAPRATPAERAFAAQLVLMTVTALGKQVSEKNLTRAQVTRWADAVSDMLLGALARYGSKRPS